MIRYLASALASLTLFAQASVMEPPRVQWTPKGRLVASGYSAPVFLTSQRKPFEVPTPPPSQGVVEGKNPFSKKVYDGQGAFWHEDHLYLTTRTQVEEAWHLLLQRQGPEGWEIIARLKRPPFFNGACILPLANGRFLVLGNPWSPEAATPERPWPDAAAIYRKGKDDHLELATQVPLKTPALLKNPGLGNAFPHPLFTDTSIVVASLEYGVFWVFSRKDGSLRHELRLFDAVTDAWITQRRSANVTLGAQAMEDGTVLIAGVPRKEVEAHIQGLDEAFRQEQTILREMMRVRKERGQITKATGTPSTLQDLMAELQRVRDRMSTVTSVVAWYRLDPDKGKLTDTQEPVGAWSLLNHAESLEHYLWLPEPDGSIRYYSHDLKVQADRPVLSAGPEQVPTPPAAKAAPKAAPSPKG